MIGGAIVDYIKTIAWTLPILFIFHDFEEIIFIKPWIRRNHQYLSVRFPNLSKKMLPHFDTITTSAFALGVAEEFMIISAITVISLATNWYWFWIGMFFVFTLHLIMHCIQALVFRRYIPTIVTSIICLPICLLIIMKMMKYIPLGTAILNTAFCLGFVLINLVIIHKGMDTFSKWQARYEKNGTGI